MLGFKRHIYATGISDRGKSRPNNEDAYLIDLDLGLFAVADGMGGHNAGELASNLAITLMHELFRKKAFDNQNPRRRLQESVHYIHSVIERIGSTLPLAFRMGTTMSVLYLRKNKYYVAHVGDSRIYLIRKGKLVRLTKDDTLVQMKVEKGILSEEEAKNAPDSHILTKAVGVSELNDIQIKKGRLKKGDIFVLATDGLTSEVDEDQLLEILKNSAGIEEGVQNLLNSALSGEAQDNITVVLVQVDKRWPFFKKSKTYRSLKTIGNTGESKNIGE